ncbi:MAG: PD40 domain-containing protein [Myxococcales bacterium]|nr:PD40 domain-containing protein [Myxococcales bacterium]
MSISPRVIVLGGASVLLAVTSCSTPTVTFDTGVADVGVDATQSPPDASDSGAQRPDDVLSLAIEPGTATIEARGAPATLALRAVAVRRDGMRTPVATAVWTVDNDRIATVAADGTLTASGLVGGLLSVRAEAPGAGGATLAATAMITVRVERVVATSGTVAEHSARFADAPMMDPARRANVLYPLDGAVMPNNVSPPDIQWERGAMGDVFRVRLRKRNATVTAYVPFASASFRYDWLPERDVWRTIADSDPGEPCTLTVDRAINGSTDVIEGAPLTITLTRGGIYGNVYYWYWTGSTEGHVMRVDDTTATRTRAIPNPPPDPARGSRCPGCHVASRDGRFLATPLGGGVDGAGVFDFTADLSANPSPTVFPVDRIRGYYFFAFDPLSTRLLGVNYTGAMHEFDARTGTRVVSAGLPMANAIHPEWSPDGTTVAFIQRSDGNGDVYTRGDLALMRTIDSENFLAPTTLHVGSSLAMAPETGSADAHPTWTPDSRWIAFAHGEHSYSGDSFSNLNDPRPFGGALYIIARVGGGAVRLDRGNGGAMGRDSYWPTFSPFITREGESGGYYWLAFMSRREYGNAQAGTRGARSRGRGGGRLQLWVTAIDLESTPGTDPSHAAYWIPGQDLETGNFGAYWAPVACRPHGEVCSGDGACCSGRCRPDPMMPSRNTCQPPPAMECRREGQTCGAASDCCAPLSCFANVCQRPIG